MANLDDIFILLTEYLWVFLRTTGLWMAMPIFGSGVLPARARLVLAWACALVIFPLVPDLTLPALWSGAWWLAALQEVLLGVLMGFSLALIFEMVRMSAEILGLTMGLGFAQMADPIRGTSAPVLGQYFNILAILLFLAFGGHLQIIEWLAVSFVEQPPGQLMLSQDSLMAPVMWAAKIFAGGVEIALPAMIALLLVNLSFGVISRAAPSLNLFAVGFPAALLFGLAMIVLVLPVMKVRFENTLPQVFDLVAGLW